MTADVPRIAALPVHADIVHHPAESRAKSTSMHGAVLAPDWVRVVEFVPAAMASYDLATTVLLYPSKDAVSLRDLPPEDLARISRVVLVDSQWQRANQVLRHPAIAALRPVRISTATTAFWRYQSHGSDHLSTVEALYYVMREFHEAKTGRAYAGEFDDLLYYFSFTYSLIQEHYRAHPDIAFGHIPDYIDYGDAPHVPDS
jgi:DTW domain-containing protein YfiP